MRRPSAQLLWISGLAAAVLLVASTLVQLRIEDAHRRQILGQMAATNRTSTRLVERWRSDQLSEVDLWARHPETVRHVVALAEHPDRGADALLNHPSQDALRSILARPVTQRQYRGFFAIARDGTNLASMRNNNVGVETLLESQPDVLEAIWSGRPTLSRVQTTDVPLGPDGRGDEPTMFALAPVRGAGGEVTAALALRVSPGQQLTALLHQARIGETGETYLLDPAGELETTSRFEERLVEQGRLQPGQSSIHHVRVEDLQGSPTAAARAAARGESGAQASPYPGYWGEQVVGAWTYEPALGASIVTEQSADEAYAVIRQARTAVLAGWGLVLATLVVVFVAWLRSNRLYREWNEELLRSRDLERASAEAAYVKTLELREAQDMSELGSGHGVVATGAMTWSPSAEVILGEGLPTRLEDLEELTRRFHESHAQRVRETLRTALEGVREATLVARMGAGDHWVRLRVHSVSDASTERPSRIVVVVQDVTEQRQERAASLALQGRVQESARLEALGRLAGGVAHDFNNYLSVVTLSTRLISMRHTDPETVQDTQAIFDASKRASDLTGQLLRFTKGTTLGNDCVQLNDVVRDLARLLEAALGEGVELELDLDLESCPVRAQRSELDQIVMNLVLNARDALPAGGVIRLATEHRDDTVRLIVADDGVGMSRDTLRMAFDRHFTTKSGGRGAGIGLATVAELVRRSNGTVVVESEVGAGTRFELRFPCALTPPSQRARDEDPGPREVSDETVLLVEDVAAIRELLVRVLEGRGFDVLPARDATTALALLDEIDGPVDILVTDIVLPGLSGALLGERFHERHPTAAVLYISGYGADLLQPEELDRRGVGFLAKPFTPELLLQNIARVLAERASVGRSSDEGRA